MGIYLAKPSTTINNEVGEGAGLEFSVGEMQVLRFLSFSLLIDSLFVERGGENIWKILI